MGEGTQEIKYVTVKDFKLLVDILKLQQSQLDSMSKMISIMNAKTPEEVQAIVGGQIIDKTDEYDKQRDIEREGQRAAEFYRKRNEGII